MGQRSASGGHKSQAPQASRSVVAALVTIFVGGGQDEYGALTGQVTYVPHERSPYSSSQAVCPHIMCTSYVFICALCGASFGKGIAFAMDVAPHARTVCTPDI